MAVIAPNSEIYLIKCPIELDNVNQLRFANATAQHNYFNGLTKLSLTKATFQRKDGTIRWPGSMEDIIEYNYCMYRNKNHGNKWFYAFIENMEYISDSMTAIKIKTDVWQTWQFDLTFKQCFVEREHVSDDTFGKHTLDEGLPTGEYIVNSYDEYGVTNPTQYAVVAQLSDLPSDMAAAGTARFKNAQKIYGGLPNGSWLMCLPWSSNFTLYESLNALIEWYNADGRIDAVVSLYVIPKSLMPSGAAGLDYTSTDGNHGFTGYFFPASTTPYSIGTHSWTRNTTVDSYTPHNKKVLCFPYNYLLMSNNGGTEVTYRWEEFSSSNATFKLDVLINQGCDQKLRPTNYKRTDTSGGYAWSITGQKLPTLSWISDYYLNWQAQNGSTAATKQIRRGEQKFNKAENFFDFVGGLGEMIGGGLNYGYQQIKNTISGIESRAETEPDTAKGNANSGDINFTLGKTCFTGYKMSVRAEVAKVIDGYFDRYGYKVSTNKIPELHSRQNWNYVKLSDCNIIADIPQSDLDEIKNLFVKGITLWHNPTTFLDYSQTNAII